MANPLEKFMHDHFVKLRQNGKKDEAHAYRKSFQVEQSTTEEETHINPEYQYNEEEQKTDKPYIRNWKK